MADKKNLSKYILLGCLYVSQYIPVSFFYQALPVFLLITPPGRKRSLILIGILQSVAIAFYILPALNIINQPILYLACISVQMTLAMAYTTEYTVMMDKSNPETAGMDFTLQASFLSLSSIISMGMT